MNDIFMCLGNGQRRVGTCVCGGLPRYFHPIFIVHHSLGRTIHRMATIINATVSTNIFKGHTKNEEFKSWDEVKRGLSGCRVCFNSFVFSWSIFKYLFRIKYKPHVFPMFVHRHKVFIVWISNIHFCIFFRWNCVVVSICMTFWFINVNQF